MSRRPLDAANESLAQALSLSFRILKAIMAILALLFLVSGSFTVRQDEVAIILRFGKVVGDKTDRILQPGIHWTWPFPISDVVKIRVGKQHSLKLRQFHYHQYQGKKAPAALDPVKDGYVLTQNSDIVHFSGSVDYLIVDPYLYKMEHENPREMLENIVSNAVLKVSTGFRLDDILKYSQEELRQAIKIHAQQKLDSIESGIKIVSIDLTAEIPRQVAADFEAATQARSENSQKITAAKTYASKTASETNAEVAKILNEAENAASELEKRMESDARYFEELRQKFREHPDIFIQRHYYATLERVIDQVQEIFMLSNTAKKRIMRVHLNRNPKLYTIKPAKEE